MTRERAFKARIYPTDARRVFLNKTRRCCRFLYNQTLHERAGGY
ncbi:MAG: helix-turn-helix domain-containing protein [Treponema sp.]|nr:helix-turn-helix domain-containing protein [Treponema sp.]